MSQPPDVDALIDALRRETPPLLRWAGGVARTLRQFDIRLEGKSSGNANTDALTLADLTVQELVLAGLRDTDPLLRRCRIEAEEETGDLAIFAKEGPLTLSLDPIDGTKQFRDRTGDGYAVMLHLRNPETVLYSIVYLPEMEEHGTWVQACGDTIRCGADDPTQPAGACLDAMTPITPESREESRDIYLIGFQEADPDRAQLVTDAGLRGFAPDDMPGSIYPLLARGWFAGSLIHTPNVYDFPVSLHLARILGGDALWVHDGRPVNFHETWTDERADMLRLPGIIACSADHGVLDILVELSRDWNPQRYTD
jgi:Inositol monophosphatase family